MDTGGLSVGGLEMGGVAKKYGAHYFTPEMKGKFHSSSQDLYRFTAYFGNKEGLYVEGGDSLITLQEGNNCDYAVWLSGPGVLDVSRFGVVLRGYDPGEKLSGLATGVNLPYVNGCATRQIFPPERQGDPTLQQLTIPPHTSEQVHHIHATARVVYVLRGCGYSIVGQAGETEETELYDGMLCILEPMCPHHFRTEDEYLTVLPVHVFSSGLGENNHPMFNGTKEV